MKIIRTRRRRQTKVVENLPGPSSTAWISVTSASFRNTLMPSGGDVWISCISFTTCRIICGERFSTFDGYNGQRK